MWILYAGARNVCITGTISDICCDLGEVWLWFVGLQAFLLCCRSNTNENSWGGWACLSSAGLINLQPALKVTYTFYFILDYSVFCHLSTNISFFITKSMEPGPFWETYPHFIEPKVSLPCLQEHATRWYLDPNELGPQSHTLFFQDLF
jgi:hypothetical protein